MESEQILNYLLLFFLSIYIKPVPSPIAIMNSKTETMICIVFNVIFLSILFPRYAPANAERIPTIKINKFAFMISKEIPVKYIAKRERSMKIAIITPVAMKASFDKFALIRKALLRVSSTMSSDWWVKYDFFQN